MPFAWPEGYAGTFTIKGRILAYAKEYKGDAWKDEEPFAVYEFDEPLTIIDDRKATDVKIMIQYGMALEEGADTASYEGQFDERGQPLTRSRSYGPTAPGAGSAPGRRRRRSRKPGGDKKAVPMARRANHVTAYTDYDHMIATPRGIDWDDGAMNRGGSPQLWVNWNDAPPNKRYIFEVKVTGGSPKYEWHDYNQIHALRSFPPYDEKPKRGGTCFIIPIRYPVGHFGAFDVEGTLYALDRHYPLQRSKNQLKSWRDAIPVATFPLRGYFAISKVTRSGEATAKITPMGTLDGSVQLFGIQPGKRVAVISAGGQTCHTIVDERSTFRLYRVGKIDNLSVTFPDYGDDVTLQVPVTINQEWTGPPTVDAEAVNKIQGTIRGAQAADLKHQGSLSWHYIQLAQCYATVSEPIDFGQWKAATLEAIVQMRKYMATIEEEEKRKRYQWDMAKRIGSIGQMAIAMGNVGEWKQWTKKAEAERAATGLYPEETNRQHIGLLRAEAQITFRQSGDLEAAQALWVESVQLEKQLQKDPARYREPHSPYRLKELFETGVAIQDLIKTLREVVQAGERNMSTLRIQRGQPDEARVLLERGYIDRDDDGNYRATSAGTQAMKAWEEAGRPSERWRAPRKRRR